MDQSPLTHLRAARFAFAIGVALITASMIGGCSSFESSWKAALEQSSSIASPSPVAPEPNNVIAPAWLGEWFSDPSGHSGQLRCVITPIAPAEGEGAVGDSSRYAFHFHALWGLNFPAEYTIEMSVTQVDGRITFEGEQDLGVLAGGVYRCKGHIEGDHFKSTYQSKYDHGTFEMTRATKK